MGRNFKLWNTKITVAEQNPALWIENSSGQGWDQKFCDFKMKLSDIKESLGWFKKVVIK